MLPLMKIGVILQFVLTTAATKIAHKRSCEEGGSIYTHGQEIIDIQYWCKIRKCQNGKWFTGYRGCIFDDKCYSVGHKWNYKCNKLECIMEMQLNMKIYKTEIVQYGCSVDGGCKKEDSEWTKNCITYKCKIQKVNDASIIESVVTTNKECFWNSTGRSLCLKNDEIVSKNCQNYRCKISQNDENHGKVILETRGCYSLNNRRTCILEGVSEKHGCSTYMCTYNGRVVEMELVEYGCKGRKGICVYDRPTINNESTSCLQQACTKRSTGTEHYACSYKGQCIIEGDTFYDEDASVCANLECRSKIQNRGKDTAVFMNMETLQKGCTDDEGTCYKSGQYGFQAVVNGVRYQDCQCKRRDKMGYTSAILCNWNKISLK